MEKLKIGVVGAGNISCNAHLPAYKNINNAVVTAIADLDIGRAKEAAERFGIGAYYGSAEELLAAADVDAIDVCTWNNGHAPVAVAAANAGKHVICEKPLTVSVSEGLRIKNAVERSGVKFMLAVPGRFGRANMYLRDMMERGELGDVYFAKTAYVRRRGTPSGWFTDTKTAGGGPVIDIGVHGIDAAWYIMGCPRPVSVSACTYSFIGDYQTKGVERWHGKSCPDNKFDTEDSGNGIIRFENGASLLFEASWAINGAPHTDTQIFGSKAGANLSPLTIYGERNGFLSDDVVNVGAEGNKFERELWHFADCVLNGKEVVYPIDQAVMMQQMLNGIYDSATSGKEIVF